jgi:hypothetical protein
VTSFSGDADASLLAEFWPSETPGEMKIDSADDEFTDQGALAQDPSPPHIPLSH